MEEYVKKTFAASAMSEIKNRLESEQEQAVVDICIMTVNDLTVTEMVEAKHMMWHIKERRPHYYVIECSHCKGWFKLTPACYGKDLFKYCPKCGAKAEGTIDDCEYSY